MNTIKRQAIQTVLSTCVEAAADTLEAYEFGKAGVVIFAHDGKTCYSHTNMSEAETLAIIEGMITLWKTKT